MWILAAIFGIISAITFVRAEHEAPLALGNASVMEVMWTLISPSVLSVATLVTFGTIIELLDQIRWSTRPPDQRTSR